VLLSGGIDSCACTQFYLDLSYDVTGFFVDYGQAARVPERAAALTLASHFGIECQEITCRGGALFGVGEIRGRNAFLILSAALWSPARAGTIAIGIHYGAPYFDCSAPFLGTVNILLDGYTDGRLRAAAPFLNLDKSQIVRYSLDHGLPLHLTYSCERGAVPACGNCLSCHERGDIDACAV
jgi:7-cyano-7-deazaguanine synthase